MRATIIALIVLAFSALMFLIGTGLAMIVTGAVGHILNIDMFTLISFWEAAILSVIFGGLGFGASSSK